MFTTFKNNVVAGSQKLVAQAVVGAVRSQASFSRSFGSMSKFERNLFMAAVAFTSFGQQQAMAQANGGAITTLTSIKTTVIGIGQVLFAIFLMVGLVKTAKKFINGEPDAMTSLLWLVGGVVLFFGFAVLKTQIAGNAQGTGAAGGGIE